MPLPDQALFSTTRKLLQLHCKWSNLPQFYIFHHSPAYKTCRYATYCDNHHMIYIQFSWWALFFCFICAFSSHIGHRKSHWSLLSGWRTCTEKRRGPVDHLLAVSSGVMFPWGLVSSCLKPTADLLIPNWFADHIQKITVAVDIEMAVIVVVNVGCHLLKETFCVAFSFGKQWLSFL